MSTPALHVPRFIRAKTEQDLQKQLLRIQAAEGGKVSILTIVQDVKTGEWVCWYYPIQSFGGGLM